MKKNPRNISTVSTLFKAYWKVNSKLSKVHLLITPSALVLSRLTLIPKFCQLKKLFLLDTVQYMQINLHFGLQCYQTSLLSAQIVFWRFRKELKALYNIRFGLPLSLRSILSLISDMTE